MKKVPDELTILPVSKKQLNLSMPAIGLLAATVLLGILLAFSTYQKINRERILIEGFLAKKGEIIARSVEAGTRTSMRHHMGQGNPLSTLVEESSREKDILFLRISDFEGQIIAQTGEYRKEIFTVEEMDRVLTSHGPLTRVIASEGLFVFVRQFRPAHPNPRRFRRMMSRGQWNPSPEKWDRLIISVGLKTDEFDLARQKDVHHTLIMAGILFLLGTAGLYFLFLYQGMHVAKSTLADMKLYTGNVIKSMPAGLITLDSQNKIVSCNPKAAKILGYSTGDIKGADFDKVWSAESLNIGAICNGSFEDTYRYEQDTNKVVQLKISGSPLQDHRGRNIGRVLTFRDVTVLHEMEQQLEWSRRMASLGKMAAGIAHEIRNPLGTLKGFAQYFGTLAGNDKDGKAYAKLMVSEVDRLDHTVSGLLQFARPREPRFGLLKLDDLFQRVNTLMESDFEDKSLNFSMTENSDITFYADGDLLLQVLLNLLKNSINATADSGRITLEGRCDSTAVFITVKDNGEGMTQDEKDRMFDPFFTTKRSGTGLGLAVSHQIIEQHSGSFEVTTSPGEGCEITVSLPITREQKTIVE